MEGEADRGRRFQGALRGRPAFHNGHVGRSNFHPHRRLNVRCPANDRALHFQRRRVLSLPPSSSEYEIIHDNRRSKEASVWDAHLTVATYPLGVVRILSGLAALSILEQGGPLQSKISGRPDTSCTPQLGSLLFHGFQRRGSRCVVAGRAAPRNRLT